MGMPDFWDDVQALVGRGLVNRQYSAHLLMKISDVAAFKAWLAEDLKQAHPRLATTPDVSGRFDHKRPGRALYQIAFSPAGLRLMGADDRVMDAFSEPFRAGMAPAPESGVEMTRRAGILGDVGANHEKNWDWGGATGKGVKGADIHVLLMIFSGFSKTLKFWLKTALSHNSGLSLACGGDTAEASPCAILTRLKRKENADSNHPVEHFGYVDGVSQPMIKGLPRAEDTRRDRPEAYRLHAVAAGEFVLGQKNERTVFTPYPTHADFGRNGSYLVVRQMAQHVGAFNEMVKKLAAHYKAEENPQELAAAKIMGRFRNGAPLTDLPREKGSLSSFGFADRDSAGLLCPFSSHIRRANPRDSREDDPEVSLRLSKRHRVMRRGRVYGEATNNDDFNAVDVEGQGVLFMCVNADIAQQYEFVQQTWLNNTTFAGLAGEVDPIVSGKEPSEVRFTAPARPISSTVVRGGALTTVKGGGYFFLPGKAALGWLAAQQTATTAQ